MAFLQVTIALVFVVLMISVKKKWMIPVGWALVFFAGTWLYLSAYASDFGQINLGVVFTAAMSSIRNFLINNDYVSYADQMDSTTYLAANILCLLSVFMTVITIVKIILSYFSNTLYLLVFGRYKHICLFTDNSTNTIHLARSFKSRIKNALCIFLNCARIAEIESENNVLFLNESTCRYLKKYKAEVFVCSENTEENQIAFEKLSSLLPHAKFYVFAEHCDEAVNKEEMLVRYLFVADGFIPAKFIKNTSAKLCIIGDNKLAVALCKELIIQCQNITGVPQITIIGAKAEDTFAFFVKSNPGLKNCAELVFVNADPMSVAGIEALTEREYHLCFFCNGDKNLPSLISPEKTVRLPGYEAIYDYDALVNLSLDKEAKKLNAEYVRHYGKGKDVAAVDAHAEWMNLSEFQRQSNRSQAINIPSKIFLYSIGVSLEQLAIEEHLRWNAFHYTNRWVYGSGADGKKDIEKRRHPCLVPYAELSQNEKDKDMLFVRKIILNAEETE